MALVDPEYKLDISMICAHVAEGKSLVDYAKALRMRYGAVLAWIDEDPERKRKYDLAIKERERWCIEQILSEVKALALVDIRKLYDATGALLPPHEWPDDVAKAVVGMDVTAPKYDKDGEEVVPEVKKIKLYDKLKALDMFGKQHSLFRERVDVHTHLSLEDLVMKSFGGDAPQPGPYEVDF